MTKTTAETPADASMHAWLRACANPSSIDAADAVLAGLLVPGELCRYVCTDAGRRWLVNNAISNGATPAEAWRSIDYIDGA